MKVLHVIPSLAAVRGGPTFLLRALVRGLAQAGVQIHVVATDDNGPDRLDVQCGVTRCEAGVEYSYFPRQTRFYSVSVPMFRWLARHVADYDLVHIHALFSFSSAAAAYWARRRDVPYVVRPLGTLNRWGIRKRRPLLKALSLHVLERRILSAAAAIHYTSEQERIEAAELGIFGRSEIIPNTVESRSDVAFAGRLRSEHPQLRNREIVLFLSRLDAKKGLDLLLPAFAQVVAQRPQAMLVIAGNGNDSYISQLRQQSTTLGLEANLLWLGFLTGSAKQAAIQDADLFVLPSYSENFGIVAAEAMEAGLPIVISDQVAIHRDVSAAKAGIVVPCQVTLLADALLLLLRDPGLRAELARNGKTLVKERYSLKAVTNQLLVLYENISSHRQVVQV